MQRVNDKLEKYTPFYGEVLGTTEDVSVFTTMLDLEQYIGREIVWVRGMSFDQVIAWKQMIPNKQHRFCTHWMKMYAIFSWVYANHDLQPVKMPRVKFSKEQRFHCTAPVKMRVGYRYDEKERRNSFTTEFEVATKQHLFGERKQRNMIFENWREGDFPMIDDPANVFTVGNYWKGKPVAFAEDSNCNNCFWKAWQQLQKNYINNPALREWTMKWEDQIGFTFHDKFSVRQIMSMPEQLGFEFIPGAYCQSGHCHD